MKLKTSDIAKSIKAVRKNAADQIIPGGYSIDSRTLSAGDCFFAIRGKNFDGHEYVAESIAKKASLIIANAASAVPLDPGWPVLYVEDTSMALRDLASAVRELWGKCLIGITGSNGKTTTKEIASFLLEAKFSVFKSIGNFNNEYGLPLSLLRLSEDHQFAVIEMGMSHRGEIHELCRIARPDLGIVTNVRPAHLENFDSIQGIAAAKRELIESLPPNGVGILNNDDRFVRKFGRVFSGKVLTFGMKSVATYRATNIRSEGIEGNSFVLTYRSRKHQVRLPLIGEHNVANCLPAIALAHHLGMDFETISQSLLQFRPVSGRGEILRFGQGFTVINDTYNSNPAALQAMIHFLSSVPGFRRKILVAGEMLELGPSAAEFHQECGRQAAVAGIDWVIGVSGLAEQLVAAASGHHPPPAIVQFFPEAVMAGEALAQQVQPGDLILMKGSRGVKTERALEVLKKKFHPNN
ncbi:MAG: UDP-N-acetylmuramoyl-tripeptide--D-alanyl-D-alanine ligase [Terriglobia bacterium]